MRGWKKIEYRQKLDFDHDLTTYRFRSHTRKCYPGSTVEQRIRNAQVGSSILPGSSKNPGISMVPGFCHFITLVYFDHLCVFQTVEALAPQRLRGFSLTTYRFLPFHRDCSGSFLVFFSAFWSASGETPEYISRVTLVSGCFFLSHVFTAPSVKIPSIFPISS